MQAIAIDAYGGGERLQEMDLPIPEISPDDVLIRVRAAGVNPADISFREGRYAQKVELGHMTVRIDDVRRTIICCGKMLHKDE